MPLADINGFRMNYELDGERDAPPLLLSNSLGTTLDMWLPQIKAWSEVRRVIRYNTRGHGRSQTPQPPYTIEAMAHDALSLLDHLHIEKADFCGLSMGGMIGMWIAVHYPQRLRRLILANTAAKIGSPEIWNNRIDSVRRCGMDAVAEQARSRWFTPRLCTEHEHVVRAAEDMLRKVDPDAYARCCEAIRDCDLHSDLKDISLKVLTISGDHDPVIPFEQSEALAAAITGSKHLRLAAAHLANLEQPEAFTEAVLDFLSDTA
jgi:3-oxoadipate enol-lactonase